jgi:hypothetical protein
MSEIALAKINSFAPIAAQTDFVPPSEEAVFIFTSGQLQEIIRQATAPILQELQALRASQEADIERLALDIALDRQRLARLENPIKEPGKIEISRADKIERYLSSRPDHRASFETLRGHLQIDNVRLNETIKILIATSDRSYSIQKEKTGDKRKRVLVMLPR